MSPLSRPTLLPFPGRPASRRPRSEKGSTSPTDYFFLPYVLSLFVALLYSAFVAVSTFCTSEETGRTAERGESPPQRSS
jgi:hypothetical protein